MRVVKSKSLREKVEGAAVVRVLASPADGMAGVTITEVELKPGATTGEHHHDSSQVVYILEGNARFANGEEEHHLSTGDLVFIPAGEVHRHDSTGSSALRQLAIFLP